MTARRFRWLEKGPLSAILLAFAAAHAPAQSSRVEFDQLAAALIQERLEMVKPKLADRKSTLESLFETAGCADPQLSHQPVHGVKDPNIICTLKGEGPGAIVVGGHYDFITKGTGAVDDWSGSVLLPSLYQSLKAKPRRHNFVFVGFTDEEQGLVGSKKFVAALDAGDRGNIRAMINLECLGMTPPKVWASRADKRLLGAYAHVASALHIEAAGSNVDKIGDDDSHPFLDAGIPVLTIHSVTTATLPVLHSRADNLKAIHADYYYDSYRLAVVYLAYLDSLLE